MDDGTLSPRLILGRARPHRGVSRSELSRGVEEVFRVVRRIDGRRVHLASRRFSLTARDGGLLTVGTSVRLRLVAISPQLRFHVVGDQNAEPFPGGNTVRAFLERSGIPTDADANLIARAIVTSQRALTDFFVRAARRLWNNLRVRAAASERRRTARAIVELVDRGLGYDEAEQMEDLFTFVGWSAGSFFDENRPRDDAPQPADPSEERTIGAYLRRATAHPNDLLQLVNALRPSTEVHWVQIPIAARRGDVTVDALLRIAWNTTTNRPERAILTVAPRSGATTWFQWRLPDAALDRVAIDENEEKNDANRYIGLVRRFISSLHSAVEPRTMGGDGFDLDEPTVPPGGVDHYG